MSDSVEKLNQEGFSKSLVSLELDLKIYNSEEVSFENKMVSKQTGVSFLELKPLLLQQAGYHSNNYPDYYKTPNVFDFDEYQKITTQDLNSPAAHNLFLFKDNKVIGAILGEISNYNVNMYEFIVDESLRGMGIGTQLLQQYLFISKQLGLQTATLETWWNQPSRKMYEKFGFVPTKQEYFITAPY